VEGRGGADGFGVWRGDVGKELLMAAEEGDREKNE